MEMDRASVLRNKFRSAGVFIHTPRVLNASSYALGIKYYDNYVGRIKGSSNEEFSGTC